MKLARLLPLVAGMLVAGIAGGFLSGKFYGGNAAGQTIPNKAEKKHQLHATHELAEFIVNLADEDPPHFAKLTIALALKAEKSEEEWKKFDPAIRDAVLEILTAKRYRELLSPAGKVTLKKEILQRIQEIVGEDTVSGIYITNFAMQ